MSERPPPGYDVNDEPLPHQFSYNFKLGCVNETSNKLQLVFLRTSNLSIQNKLIHVNHRHADFAKDTGPLVQDESIINRIRIRTTIMATEQMLSIDRLPAMAYYWYNIHGAFEDSWTPADKLTTTTIAQLLHVTSDTTNEDVVPETSGANLGAVDHPVSTVTGTEVFGTYDLSTTLTPENTTDDANILQELYDAKSYYTNGGKLNSLMGHINRKILTPNRTIFTMYEDRFVPRQCRHGNPHMYFGRQYLVPAIGDIAQVLPSSTLTSETQHLGGIVTVNFNEWNRDFDQSRGG